MSLLFWLVSMVVVAALRIFVLPDSFIITMSATIIVTILGLCAAFKVVPFFMKE